MTGAWNRIADILRSGGVGVMVTVLEVKGSGPREPGARMIVSADTAVSGTIGGGALEWQALAEAQALLHRSDAPVQLRDYALGPDLGQCCGGRVTLVYERFSEEDLPQAAVFEAEEKSEPFWLELDYSAGTPARTLSRAAEKEREARGASAVRTGPQTLLLRFGHDATPLLVFGSGHVGRALMLALAQLPFRVRLIDSRGEALPRAAPPNAELCHTEQPVQELAAAPDGAFVLIMTHSHALDQDIVLAALKQNRFGYVGLIGSATKRARFVKRLGEAGVARDALDALVCPIGISSVTSKEPAAIAIGIAAQLLERKEKIAAARKDHRPGTETRHAAG